MLRLKSCPKCKRGDVVLDRDHYGWYEYCMQCGYVCNLKSTVDLGQKKYCCVGERRRTAGSLDRGK